MSDALVVEFELSAHDVSRLHPRRQMVRSMIYVGLFGAVAEALAVLAAIMHKGSDARFVLGIVLLPVVTALSEWLIPRARRAVCVRETGTARITLSDGGIEYHGVGGEANVEWTRVQSLFDRSEYWTISTRQPDRTFHIPKSAVLTQRVHLADELSSWSGKSVREVGQARKAVGSTGDDNGPRQQALGGAAGSRGS